ncbi:MAG: DUF222 domain-containing protein [Chloroflexi bacterium]|nr:MAG: DUF222 domain-containing protein [Chloroflexota bacterium]
MATSGPPIKETRAVVRLWADWFRRAEPGEIGNGLSQLRESGIDPFEAVFAEGVRRFEKSGEYVADGALGIVAWLRSNCKLSGGAAAERVEIARQLEQLPKTEAAFARGELGYQHVAVLAHTAQHVGVEAVQQAEASLLKAAEAMDPGQFTGVAKNFEHRVDAAAALTQANRAYERRYLHVGEPMDGVVRLDGLLDAEGGAILRTALNAGMLPGKDDGRTSGQRRADALVELCRRKAGGSATGAGPRPHLVIRASLDTLLGAPGAPAGELEVGGLVPGETVRRLACDAALTRITGRGELEAEISHASRSIPPATRRAVEARDRTCVAGRCDRPPQWTDCHHLEHWTQGGPTILPNLVLLCRRHHRMVHEGGWGLRPGQHGRWGLVPPVKLVAAHARSA